MAALGIVKGVAKGIKGMKALKVAKNALNAVKKVGKFAKGLKGGLGSGAESELPENMPDNPITRQAFSSPSPPGQDLSKLAVPAVCLLGGIVVLKMILD